MTTTSVPESVVLLAESIFVFTASPVLGSSLVAFAPFVLFVVLAYVYEGAVQSIIRSVFGKNHPTRFWYPSYSVRSGPESICCSSKRIADQY